MINFYQFLPFFGLIIIDVYNSNYLSINNNQNAEDIFVLMALYWFRYDLSFFERFVKGKLFPSKPKTSPSLFTQISI